MRECRDGLRDERLRRGEERERQLQPALLDQWLLADVLGVVAGVDLVRNELDERDLVAREPPACGLEPDELPFQPLVVDVGEEIRRAVGDRGVRGFRFCLDLRA